MAEISEGTFEAWDSQFGGKLIEVKAGGMAYFLDLKPDTIFEDGTFRAEYTGTVTISSYGPVSKHYQGDAPRWRPFASYGSEGNEADAPRRRPREQRPSSQ
jgi:hypothetical protein